jgi:hypothetical protein
VRGRLRATRRGLSLPRPPADVLACVLVPDRCPGRARLRVVRSGVYAETQGRPVPLARVQAGCVPGTPGDNAGTTRPTETARDEHRADASKHQDSGPIPDRPRPAETARGNSKSGSCKGVGVRFPPSACRCEAESDRYPPRWGNGRGNTSLVGARPSRKTRGASHRCLVHSCHREPLVVLTVAYAGLEVAPAPASVICLAED